MADFGGLEIKISDTVSTIAISIMAGETFGVTATVPGGRTWNQPCSCIRLVTVAAPVPTRLTRNGDGTYSVDVADAGLATLGALLSTGVPVFGRIEDANGDSLVGLLSDGAVTASVELTDQAGNTVSASDSFTLDTTADAEDSIVLGVTVDSVINDAESGNVSLTLSGVDGDAVSVTVTHD